MRTDRGIRVLVVLLLILTGPILAADEPHPISFSTTTIDGEAFDLASLRGNWVVVNFWATWCKPCRKEMPEFSELHTERDDIFVIGLAFEEITPEEVRAFLEEYPVSYPIALVDVYEPPEVFGTPRVLPTTMMVSPKGVKVKTFLGPVTREMLENFIDATHE